VVELPLLADALAAAYGDLFVPGRIPPRRLDLNAVAVLFELALGLSAWKEYRGSRWALRCNPSSGNLHPTEGYAILPPLPGIEAGVYHYDSRDHALERRRAFSADESGRLASLLPAGSFLIGLSSVDTERARNIQLLKERAWFDIPVVYNDGRRAIIAIEKGTPGERAFARAFEAWGQ